MFEYFTENPRLRVEAISEQVIAGGNEELAKELDQRGELIAIPLGERFIAQGEEEHDIFLILAGTCEVVVNGRPIARRGPRTHVGEMASIAPTQVRAADCIASENMVALRLSEADFSEIGTRFPNVYRSIARELAHRLLERNKTVGTYREAIRVFIISSAEALPVARQIQSAFEYDPFTVVVWTDGVFKVSNYPLDDLEAQIQDSDFAIAIAHTDDVTQSRGEDWPAPRDNVVFELGLFLGRLGRNRAILMEPREEGLKLPSDLAGITTISYVYEEGNDTAAMLAPACNKLRNHINEFGPHNG